MISRTMVRTALALSLLYAAWGQQSSHANHVLVGNPFISSYENWVDPLPSPFLTAPAGVDPAPVLGRGGNWRISLHNPTLMETSDLIPPGNNPAAGNNNGSFVPSLLIQDAFVTPSTYDLNARLYSSDDDGFGVVFGYQDTDNYFRVLLRGQDNGNLGATTGLSIQKVVGGVATQINPNGTGEGFRLYGDPPVFTPFDTRALQDVAVSVAGNDYEVFVAGANDDNAIWSGSDTDLQAGKVGVFSWAQRNRTGNQPHWGTELESISVSDDSGVLYNGAFTNIPVQWRPLYMANSNGARTNDPPSTPTVIIGDDRGNFGLDLNNPWILQQTNGYEWATPDAPKVDFIGPAVVVDEPGSENFADYEMNVRLGAVDDDGIGVLVRVQDDDNFYRLNFTNQRNDLPAGTPDQRTPQGLSIQKVQNGAWSEIWSDDPSNPLFVHAIGGGTSPPNPAPDPGTVQSVTPATNPPETTLPMFDLQVRMVGNTFDIQVIDHLGNVIDYPLITDSNNPLLTGTVGLATWGNEYSYFMAHGGGNGPLLTHIPEPTTIALALLAGLGLLAVRRGRRA